MIQSRISSWNLQRKRVLLRADLNLPISNTDIISDIRLISLLPTLRLLLDKGAQVIITTHIGNPNGIPNASLSTQRLIPFLQQYVPQIVFAPDIQSARQKTQSAIILVENLRFFDGEQSGDISFAQDLASLGQYYVNDAFATLHRDDSSITLVPTFFAQDHRSCGLLVERELNALNPLKTNPTHPFICIVGGNKPGTKIPYLTHLQHADTIIALPTISNCYMYTQNQKIGASPVEQSAVTLIQEQHKGKSQHIVLPSDYLVASGSLIGPLRISTQSSIEPNDTIVTIGPKTLEYITTLLSGAKTIFINGLSGLEERAETLGPAYQLLKHAAHSEAFTVICGGNTISLAQQYNLLDYFDLCSTGGGATLAYISGQTLPGLTCL